MTTSTRAEAVPTGWRYSINYGPDGEENFANVYAADGQFVGNLRTHHAIAICNAFAVCEKLAYAPAPASGGVDAVDWRALFEAAHGALICIASVPGDWQDYASRTADDLTMASLSPAAAPVSEAGGERLLRQMRALAMALHAKHYAEDAPGWQPLEDAEGILSQIDNMTAALAKPASSSAGGDVEEREVAAQAALARIKKLRDQYADQAKFADVDEARLFRQFVERLDRAALSQSTDKPTEKETP